MNQADAYDVGFLLNLDRGPLCSVPEDRGTWEACDAAHPTHPTLP